MTEEYAQIIGLKGLAFLAEDAEIFGGFLQLTGMSAEDIHLHASETSTIIGILDYLLSDESLLLNFCSQANIAPELPRTARMVLSREDYY